MEQSEQPGPVDLVVIGRPPGVPMTAAGAR